MRYLGCICVLALAACGGATGPTRMSAAQLFNHFDSLSHAECPPNYTGVPMAASCTFVAAAEQGAAEGVVPSRIAVETSVGSGEWYGYMWRTQGYGRTPAETSYTLVTYDGLSVQHAAVVELTPPLHHPPMSLLADSIMWTSGDYDTTSAQYTITTDEIGGHCAVVSASAPLQSPYCRTAQFQISMTVGMYPWAGSTLPIQTITVPLATVTGVVADSSGVSADQAERSVR